jgi:6-phosphogluconolactonase (cycloisomerase 2 family)
MVVDTWGKYLYVISSSGNSIDAFQIDAILGALTPIAGSPYTLATLGCVNPFPTGITDLFGRFLYTSDEASEISGYAIVGKTGTLTELARSPFPVSGGCPNGTASPRGITTEPTGRFLYVMNADYFSIYSINAGNGVLTHVKDTTRISNGLLHAALRADPSGNFLYASKTSSGGDKVVGFSIDPVSGDLTALPVSPFPIGSNVAAFDLVVTP